MPQSRPRADHRSVLEDLLRPVAGEPSAQSTTAPVQVPAVPQPTQGKRRRLTVSVDPLVLERARTVVYYSPGLTLVDLITQALRTEIARREAEHDTPFPASRGPLRTGSPIR
jgi:hypothetical protein